MSETVEKEAVTIDSDDYRHTFWGILNAQGRLWTPVAFESEEAARKRVRDFFGADPDNVMGKFQFVPVRIQLTARQDRAS